MSSANTNIPRSVVEQGKLADALIEGLQADNTDESTVTPENMGNGSTVGDGISTGSESQSTTESELPVTDGQDQLEKLEPASMEGNLEYWQELAKTWESRYQTLAGKYNKEIGEQKHLFYSAKPELDRLQAENGELLEETKQLKLQLDEKTKELLNADKSEANQGPNIKEMLGKLEEQYGEYGEELGNVLSEFMQASSTEANSRLEEVMQAVSEIKNTVDTVKTESAAATQKLNQHEQQQLTEEQQAAKEAWDQKAMQLADLLKNVGVNWAEVDNDPLFHDWLQQKNESGTERNTELLTLFRAGDLKGAAGMYLAYLNEAGTMRNNSNADLSAEQSQSSTDLSDQVQVETKAPIVNNEIVEAPAWTPEEISKFYSDCTRGKYTAAEKEKIEREIFAQLNG